MVTKLHGLLKRELEINGRAYAVALDESGIKLTLKGHRLGQELEWAALASGDAALATALNASLTKANDFGRSPKSKPARKSRPKPKPKSS